MHGHKRELNMNEKLQARYSRRLDLVRDVYLGAPSAFRAGISIPSSPTPRFSELRAALRALDEALASESEDGPASAPKGPDLFSRAPRSQPPVLVLLVIGLEVRAGCSPDVSTEVGCTVTLLFVALDLGLDVVLIKGSLEVCAAEPEPLCIPISSLVESKGTGYLSLPSGRAGAAEGTPILTTQAVLVAVIKASRSDVVALIVLERLGVKPFRGTVPSRSMARRRREGVVLASTGAGGSRSSGFGSKSSGNLLFRLAEPGVVLSSGCGETLSSLASGSGTWTGSAEMVDGRV